MRWDTHLPNALATLGGLARDAAAGANLALAMLPKALAYAAVAGVPPAYGLYASCAAPAPAVAFGSNRLLFTGPVGVMAVLVLSSLRPFAQPFSPGYIELAACLTLMVGALTLLFAAARLGFLVRAIPTPVTEGWPPADDDLAGLLQQYADEASAAWAYTKALLAFRQHGDTPEACQLLKMARKSNKHVPAYLLGEKFPPTGLPGYYSRGDESEALNYIGSFLAAWKSTPGAIAWLRENVEAKKQKEASSAKGPLSFIKKWLTKHMPQEYDVWQADFRQMPNWIRIAGEMVRPWTVLVTSRSNDIVLGHQMSEEAPSSSLLWDALVQAIQYPAAGEPHRPTELQVRADERWEVLKPHLDEIGVGLVVAEELDQLSEMFKEMTEHVCGKPQPGLLDMPGVTPAQVGSFYDAAAFFFRQAPWKKVGYEAAIQVECDRFQSGPWYAVLMGQSGLTTGVALYEDLKALRRLWAGDRGDEDHARQSVATTVTFGEEWDIPVADLEAAKKHGWQVARPDAYPEVFHKERGLSLRPPLAWELELVEGCLRAVPEFVAGHQQDDPARDEITVPVASGQLNLVLSWVVDDG